MSIDIVFFVLILASIIGGFFFLAKNQSQKQKPDDQALLLLQDRLEKLSGTLDAKLGESKTFLTDFLIKQSGESNKIVKEVTSELTKVTESQRQMASVADQLKSLQDI